MTNNDLLNAMGRIDPKLIADAAPDVEQKKSANKTWVKWASLAACFVLLVSAIIIVVPMLSGNGQGSIDQSHNPPNSDAPYGNNTPGLYQTTFDFDSYEEMIEAFQKRDLDPSSYTIQELKDILGEPYTHFVDKVNADRAFPHPMLDNQPISYRNEEGFSNITFFVSELYGLPWIWYFPNVSTGENFYISITYLPDSMLETQKNPTASEVIKELSPNSPNVNNLGNQHENIYNQNIKLSDREVTALVIEYKTDNRDSVFFVYDNLLVMVRCDPKVWSAQWFSTLTLEGGTL